MTTPEELKLAQELREKTDMALSDCNRALKACDGDMVKAESWLKQQFGGRYTYNPNRSTP